MAADSNTTNNLEVLGEGQTLVEPVPTVEPSANEQESPPVESESTAATAEQSSPLSEKDSHEADCKSSSTDHEPKPNEAKMSAKEKSPEKAHLPHQESFHQINEMQKDWGIVRIDINRRTETFKNIMKNSLYGNGDIFEQVCIVDGNTNKVLAAYPDDFCPSCDQIGVLEKAKVNPGDLAAKGIKLAGKVFTYNRSEQSGGGRTSSYNLYGVYEGEDGKGGVMIFPTNNYIVCGCWHASPEDCGTTQLENMKFRANERISAITDWLSSTGM